METQLNRNKPEVKVGMGVRLPSQSTLTGFSITVDKQPMDLAKVDSCPERDKYIIIIMDEMHIREDIVTTSTQVCVCVCVYGGGLALSDCFQWYQFQWLI